MGWLIGACIAAIIALLPIGISAAYGETGGTVYLLIGPVKHCLFPGKIKKSKKTDSKKTVANKEQGGSYAEFLPLLENVLEILSDLRRRIVITKLQCRLTLAGGDPCDLAIHYGKAWTILGNLMPLLERLFLIRKKDLSVGCDFVGDQTRIQFYIKGRITLARLLIMIAVHGASILNKYYHIMNQRKGGVNS